MRTSIPRCSNFVTSNSTICCTLEYKHGWQHVTTRVNSDSKRCMFDVAGGRSHVNCFFPSFQCGVYVGAVGVSVLLCGVNLV